MHKLTNLEAQRVIAVLEDAVERIGLLSHIPLKPDLDLLSRIDDLGLKDATKQQWQVEERHRLLERCPYDDGKDTKPESVSSQMTSTIRNLCRNLKKDENISLVKARNLPTSSTLLVHQQYFINVSVVLPITAR